MPILAQDKRKRFESELQLLLYLCRSNLVIDLKKRLRYYEDPVEFWMNARYVESVFHKAYSTALDSGVPVDTWIRAQKEAIERLLGDPQQMLQSPDQLRHHAVPYWNPTAKRVNIFSLGLMREKPGFIPGGKKPELETVEWVEPGDRVFIPYPYTVGGKHSTIHGIAPQLRALPEEMTDTDVDVMPTTYIEWCTFLSAHTYSPCCSKPIAWSDTHNRLMCTRCGARCIGV